MHRHAVRSALILSFALATPALAAPPAYKAAVADYFAGEYAASPTEATAEGLHAGDARLDDMSAAAHLAEAARLHATLARLAAIPASSLTPMERDDRDVLTGQIGGALLELETIQQWRHNPATYVDLATNAIYELIERDFAPLTVRLADVIAREQQLPTMLGEARKNLSAMPPVFIDIALEELEGGTGFIAHDVPQAFASIKDPAATAKFAASTKAVLAAFASYKAWIIAEKPKAHGSFVLGRAALQRLLAADLITETPEQVLAAGRAQLDKDRKAFQAAAAKLDPKNPDHALDMIGADHPDAAHLIPMAREGLVSLQRFIAAKKILTLPSTALPVVAETPPFSRALVFGEMDPPGPYETHATTAYYYITPPDTTLPLAEQNKYLEYFNRTLLENLSVHEALPGHFVQFLFGAAHPEWSDIRKTAHSYTTTEGWAHYSEQMMADEGLGNTDGKLRLAQLQDALLRDCRLIASISMHTNTMTLAQASDMMGKTCLQPASVAYKEARRGTSDPGYFSYTLGKLEILKLRSDVQAREGKAFTIAHFHDRFLGAGLVPVSIIRREILGQDGPAL
jgi:uncharacterized protein (DUF885 family)